MSQTTDLFPVKIIVEWSDGTKREMEFAAPKASAKGNLNAHAGDKLVRQKKVLRINCNVTESRG